MKRREFAKNVAVIGMAIPFSGTLFSFADGKKKYTVTVGDNAEKLPSGQQFAFNSTPVFFVTKGSQQEWVVMNTEFEVEALKPKKNRAGYREVDMKIKKWEGTGYSQLLQQEIQFKLSDVSYCGLTSKVLNQDFPANFEFHFDYDLYANGKKLASRVAAKGKKDVENMQAIHTRFTPISSQDVYHQRSNDSKIMFCVA